LPDLTANWTECTLTEDEEKVGKLPERKPFYVPLHMCRTVPADQVGRSGTEYQHPVSKWTQQ
jgi:hypothetical protein